MIDILMQVVFLLVISFFMIVIGFILKALHVPQPWITVIAIPLAIALACIVFFILSGDPPWKKK